MKRLFLILFLVFGPTLAWADGTCGSVGKTGTSPYTADSASYENVNACLNGGSPVEAESTVLVPNGTETWGTTLTISTGVDLIGGQGGTTTITGTASPVIKLAPSNYTANYATRISRFSFNMTAKTWMHLGTGNKDAPFTMQNELRIDNNIVTISGMHSNAPMFWNYGHFYGVVNNNTFTNSGSSLSYFIRNYPEVTADDGWWSTSPQNIWEFGSEYGLYFEDNIWTDTSTEVLLSSSANSAGKQVFRYNTINIDNPGFPLIGTHGEQTDAMESCFGMESYGNDFSNASETKLRSGRNIIAFNNNSTSNVYFYSTCPLTYAIEKNTHDTYFFLNRANYTGSPSGIGVGTTSGDLGQDPCGGLTNIPTLGRDVFGDATSPDVDCGASKPGTCSKGEGYFETSDTTVCTDLTNYVGVNPTTKITGTLYQCGDSNNWPPLWTPLTYPHPLRSEAGTPPTFSSASLADGGLILSVVFNELVTKGAGYSDAHFNVDSTYQGALTVTWLDGDGTETHRFTLSSKVMINDTLDIDFTPGATTDTLKDSEGTDLIAFSNEAIFNGSKQNPIKTSGMVIGMRITNGE